MHDKVQSPWVHVLNFPVCQKYVKCFYFSSTGKECAVGRRGLFVTWNLRTYTIFELLHALQVSIMPTAEGRPLEEGVGEAKDAI